jgi:hypothetical protein
VGGRPCTINIGRAFLRLLFLAALLRACAMPSCLAWVLWWAALGAAYDVVPSGVWDADRRILVVFSNNSAVNTLERALSAEFATPVRNGNVTVRIHPCPDRCMHDASCFDLVEGACCDDEDRFPFTAPLIRIGAPGIVVESRCTGTRVLIRLTQHQVEQTHRLLASQASQPRVFALRAVLDVRDTRGGGGLRRLHVDMTATTGVMDRPRYMLANVPFLVTAASLAGYDLTDLSTTAPAMAAVMVSPPRAGDAVQLDGGSATRVAAHGGDDDELRGHVLDMVVLGGNGTLLDVDPLDTRVGVTCAVVDECTSAGDVVLFDRYVLGAAAAWPRGATQASGSGACPAEASATTVYVMAAVIVVLVLVVAGLIGAGVAQRFHRRALRRLRQVAATAQDGAQRDVADDSTEDDDSDADGDGDAPPPKPKNQ